MNKLQKALSVNAVFSGVSGIVFVIWNKPLSRLFNVAENSVFWIVGLGLFFFMLTIILEIKKQRNIPLITNSTKKKTHKKALSIIKTRL